MIHSGIKCCAILIGTLFLASACKQASTDTTEAKEKVIQEVSQAAQNPSTINVDELWEAEIPSAEITEPKNVKGSDAAKMNYILEAEATSLKWHGSKVASGHHGTIDIPEGVLRTVNGKLVDGAITVDMKSIKNVDLEEPKKRIKLESHLKSDDFFGAEKFPIAEFVIVEVKNGSGEEAEISGNLTLKGITHLITFPATVTITEDHLAASALFSIDRSKWDVKYGSGSFFDDLGDKLIKDNIDLSLNLVARIEA
ncbi:MAG: YceI family protein [Bacteroidota bacterium]